MRGQVPLTQTLSGHSRQLCCCESDFHRHFVGACCGARTSTQKATLFLKQNKCNNVSNSAKNGQKKSREASKYVWLAGILTHYHYSSFCNIEKLSDTKKSPVSISNTRYDWISFFSDSPKMAKISDMPSYRLSYKALNNST